jgi:hypothetical protein
MSNTFLRYKEEIKESYATVKGGKHANFLLKPTTAKLRDLCIMLCRENSNANDQLIFKNFFGFEFETSSIQKIKKETEKFKPIVTFLKGETELSDSNYNAADITAFLVNFELRPYSKFLGQGHSQKEKPSIDDLKSNEGNTIKEATGLEKVNSLSQRDSGKKQPLWKTKRAMAALLPVLIFAGYTAKNQAFPSKECMQWDNDHYEEVVCEGKKIGFAGIDPIFDKEENLLDFKKIKVCDTTTFFKDGQPLVWYIKQNGACEYFNGPGLHPLSGKPLHPITAHIIEAHIKE